MHNIDNKISVCWDVTSRCNENCRFCYRNTEDKELTLKENIKILKNWVDAGAKKITFTGGEPLLYKNLFQLASFGKKYSRKLKLSLTTNALLLINWDKEKNIYTPNVNLINKIASLFDWISIPLDASSADIESNMTRNPQHFERILFLIDYINSNYPKLKIKINTLVSKVNYNEIINLFELLREKDIKRWKLFHFMPSRGDAASNKEQFYISEELFNEVCSRLDLELKPSMRVTFNSYKYFQHEYFCVSVDGYLTKFDGKNYTKLVDCRKDMKEYFNLSNGHIYNYLGAIKIPFIAQRRSIENDKIKRVIG